MPHPETSPLPSDWRNIFATRGEELDKHFKGQYDLGIAPVDIARILKNLKHTKYWLGGRVSAHDEKVLEILNDQKFSALRFRQNRGAWPDGKPYIDRPSLTAVFQHAAENHLNREQQQALDSIAYCASRIVNAPREMFSQGYGMYIKIALLGDKLPKGLYFSDGNRLGFEDIMQMSSFGDEPAKRMFDLAQITYQQLPLFVSLVDAGYPTADYNHKQMVLAGAGLAYEHCFAIIADSEIDTADEYFTHPEINPQA